uniref:Uncharacterized protein n=1 Tax=Leersia perrieri TaxID=77586 RepID=A0A0D9WHJ8_9ORYZ
MKLRLIVAEHYQGKQLRLHLNPNHIQAEEVICTKAPNHHNLLPQGTDKADGHPTFGNKTHPKRGFPAIGQAANRIAVHHVHSIPANKIAKAAAQTSQRAASPLALPTKYD